VIDNIVQFDSM